MALDEMPFSTSAYLGDTQHLSLQQHGAYTLILWSMWRSGGWIADDEKMLARICKTNVTGWRKLAPVVRALLTERDGRLTQKRLLCTYEECLDQHQKRVLAGSSGGRAKALKSKEAPPSNATDLLEGLEGASYIDSYSKDKEVSKRPPRRAARARIAEDWSPDDAGIAYAVERGFSEAKISAMIVACRDYHLKHGTLIAGEVGLAATWRTWVNNDIKWNGHKKGNGDGSKSVIEAGKRLLATMAGPQAVRPNGAAQARAGSAGNAPHHSDVRLLPER